MKEQILKAMQRNQLVEMMYMDKNGEITKRRIKIIKAVGDSFQAFCFMKNAKRTFIIDNVLAAIPVSYRERGAI
ncbi:MAG: transcriptional regulator [Lysinibacillus sp.]